MTAQPDDDDEAFVRRVAAAQAVRLGRPVPVDLHPYLVRRDAADDRGALMIALWALRRDGALTPDAIDVATDGFGPATIAAMPYGVAHAIITRTPGTYRGDLWPALDAVLDRFDGTDEGRAHAELAAHGLARATRTALGDVLTGTVIDTIAEHLVLFGGLP